MEGLVPTIKSKIPSEKHLRARVGVGGEKAGCTLLGELGGHPHCGLRALSKSKSLSRPLVGSDLIPGNKRKIRALSWTGEQSVL